jgi:hypothetical protein
LLKNKKERHFGFNKKKETSKERKMLFFLNILFENLILIYIFPGKLIH